MKQVIALLLLISLITPFSYLVYPKNEYNPIMHSYYHYTRGSSEFKLFGGYGYFYCVNVYLSDTIYFRINVNETENNEVLLVVNSVSRSSTIITTNETLAITPNSTSPIVLVYFNLTNKSICAFYSYKSPECIGYNETNNQIYFSLYFGTYNEYWFKFNKTAGVYLKQREYIINATLYNSTITYHVDDMSFYSPTHEDYYFVLLNYTAKNEWLFANTTTVNKAFAISTSGSLVLPLFITSLDGKTFYTVNTTSYYSTIANNSPHFILTSEGFCYFLPSYSFTSPNIASITAYPTTCPSFLRLDKTQVFNHSIIEYLNRNYTEMVENTTSSSFTTTYEKENMFFSMMLIILMILIFITNSITAMFGGMGSVILMYWLGFIPLTVAIALFLFMLISIILSMIIVRGR